jgi:cob(I)alamin adenosyltransferase
MSADEAMQRIDTLLSHVWMVRAFLKHSPEAEEDEELCEVHRTLYDCMLALGGPLKEQNAAAYLAAARKKLSKLRKARDDFAAMQPHVSTHTNFQMANVSLTAAVDEVARVLADAEREEAGHSPLPKG